MSFKYDIFFSYRHKPLDGEITQKCFNAVESYRVPRSLRERGCEDVRRAFRDTEELSVSRILSDTIDQALRSTRCLIIVCSTDTPSSEWVDREVATFIELGRADHIYPLLISGDRESSFPKSLKLVPDLDDRIMDIRTPGNDVKKMMAKAETELLRAISEIAGCTEAELLREHKLRKNRRFAAKAAAGFAAFAAVAGISLGLMNLAQNYRDIAKKREAASMRILSELTYSLPDHLTNVPGAYSRIADILARNTEDINAILRLSSDRNAAENEAAANYEKLANASAVLGHYEDAVSAQETAIGSYEDLAEHGAEGSGEKLASAYNNLGNLYHASGRYEEASEAYLSAITRQNEAGEDPARLADFYLNAGANATDMGDEKQAADYFDLCIGLLGDEVEEGSLETAARVHQNYGVLLYRDGKYPEAESHLRLACGYCEKRLAEVESLQNLARSVQCKSMLAAVLTDSGNFEEADKVYADAIQYAELLAQDMENTAYQRQLAELYNNRALSLNMHGDYAAADELYIRAADITGSLARQTNAASDLAAYALSLLNLGENTFKLTDYGRSRDYFEEGLTVYKTAIDGLGEYDLAQYRAWESYFKLIHDRDFSGSFDAGYAAFQLQPNNVFVDLVLGYACLYCGYEEDAEMLLSAVASLGEGQVEMIKRDLDAQKQAGLPLADENGLLERIGIS
ncbi:MAG: tetratricopeptide repeat protein [Clostridia bacterium]|nr:tetratricopeptide repeat protein [Clostridia bacterium]